MNKRMILAFALAVLFFIIYVHLILPWIAPQSAQPQSPNGAAPETPNVASTAAESPVPPAETPNVASTAAEAQAPPPAEMPSIASTAVHASPAHIQVAAAPVEIPARYRQENLSAADERTLSGDLLTVVFTPVSGSIKSVTLKGARFTNFQQDGPLVLLKDFTTGEFPTQIANIAGEGVGGRLYALESVGEPEKPGEPQRISFATVLDSGLKITKTYALEAGKYGLKFDIRIENLGAARQVTYDLRGPAGIPSENYDNADVLGVLATVPAAEGINGKMDYQEVPALKLLASLGKDALVAAPGRRADYAGAANKYFASVLRPDPSMPLVTAGCYAVADSEKAKLILGDKDPVKTAKEYGEKDRAAYFGKVFYTVGSKFTVGPVDLAAAGAGNASVTHSFVLYCGPKDKDSLGAFDGTGFQRLLDYGLFEPLVKVLLYVMKAFHAVIPNWGIAIILLTALVRLAIHPLMRKSQISMTKMAKLQPHIKKLQEKYKGDKQKLGQEQMKLMKEHGANPLGGCLPLLIQIPILWALYRGLMVSIDLRHASFYIIPYHWIKDLAQPDMLFTMPVTLPLLGSTFNLLPILMAVATALQQLWQPKAATPDMAQQQKIMGIFMPVLMGVMFYSLASGLNLYFLTTTVWGIVEQAIIKRHIARQDTGPAPVT